ncbi:ROK family protein [Schaalia vaccimaxillae]|uniref:ROK family protein n=1 Tax=Schaalia vaccimaxillae TaxID=183916 RepID=UPI0003B550A5|nr:ROK family protein [Schaalia vaccimaxillae]
MPSDSSPRHRSGRRKAASQADVRQQNLALLAEIIFSSDSPPSRAGLAAQTGLGRATVSRLVQELIMGGIVCEKEPEDTATRGRPGTPLAPAERTIAGIGLEINVDFVAGRAIDLAGTTLGEFRLDGLDSVANSVQALRLLGDSAAAMVSSLIATGVKFVGATLSIPGLVNAADGELLIAPNLGWSSFSPIDALGQRWAALEIPISTRNDADMQSLTGVYSRPGKAQENDSFLYIAGDIGIGGALVVNGRPTRGDHGWAGEIGHVTVDPTGPKCSCGSQGCLEAFAGQSAVLAASGLTPTSTSSDLVALLAQKDEKALAVAERAGWALALAISDVVNILDISRVVFGTSLGAILPWLLPHIEKDLSKRVIGFANRGIELVRGPNISSPACTGGAFEMLHSIISDPATWLDRQGDLYS